MDEQLKNLKFDIEEEIAEREKFYSQRRGTQPMDTSHAIIVGAIIIVVGLWGGKLFYDYIQEQRIKAAFQQVRSLIPPIQLTTQRPTQTPQPQYQQSSKPFATQAGEALHPVAKAVGDSMTQTGLEFMAGGDGFLGEGARIALKQQERLKHRNELGNTNIVRSLKECMKPDNVVDNEVKACTEGKTNKTW